MARRALSPAQLAVVQAVRAGVAAPQQRVGELVVGLSGGADSLALTAAVAHLGLDATAVVVDHGLQDGSDAVAARAAEQARSLGLAARVVRVDVATGHDGLEAAARTARLAALTATGRSVLLAHTLDDQAETVLLGLGRGSGPRSLQGMAPEQAWGDGVLVRPLLGVRRAVVRQACADGGLVPWDDPMNDDPHHRRVRVRHELLPLMDEVLGHGAADALARTATLLREDVALLDELARQAGERCSVDGGWTPGDPTAGHGAAGEGLSADALSAEPPALRSRVVRSWLLGHGVVEPTSGHVAAVLGLVDDWHGQKGVDLPGGVRVVRRSGVLRGIGPDGHRSG